MSRKPEGHRATRRQPGGRRPAGAGGRPRPTAPEAATPDRPRLVLAALICATGVATLNLSVGNVALPTIGQALDASQAALDFIAVSYTLGLAASVLYFGALGDRYGRKLFLVVGIVCGAPASMLAAYAPTVGVLALARLLTGMSAGMAYPTSLALITALWRGPPRIRAIAVWAAAGTAMSALGPLTAGWLLERFWWGSAFLVTLPLAIAGLALSLAFVPAKVNEHSRPVDHVGGVLSMVFLSSMLLAVSFAPAPGLGAASVGMAIAAVVTGAVFYLRQLRAAEPLFDLRVARRRVFWVAAVAGVVVFGSLIAAMFVGQQFVQNVLGYSPLQAGLALVPSAALMVAIAPYSARLVRARGSRFTLLSGYACCLLGFAAMLILWRPGVGYWGVLVGYCLTGAGVRLAGTPAAHSLTDSVPVHRAGMASGTSELQGDLGGALMQAILGVLLTAGYAARIGDALASSPNRERITDSTANALQRSFAGAQAVARQYPAHADKITEAAKSAFLAGSDWAFIAGMAAVLLAAILVFFAFPAKQREEALHRGYHAQDEISRRG